MSWMFSSIARPSSVLAAGPSCSTVTGLLGLSRRFHTIASRPPHVLIHAVGKHADRLARAVDVELRARRVGEHRGLGLVVGDSLVLRRVYDRIVLHLPAHRLGQLGDGWQLVDRRRNRRPGRSCVCGRDLHADVGELGDELAEVAPQALDFQPDQPVLKLDQGELGRELGRVAAAVQKRLVNTDRPGAQIGHRAILGVQQVRVRRRPERRGYGVARTAGSATAGSRETQSSGDSCRRGFLGARRRFCPS